ncbi:hypothetical protein ACH49N_38795, partial [Rhodococcus sp. NPDC019647]|uniref:hypothetical protein n=1 Tax=Rhodococcus sp. NPDC019647 TaxID=3364507 RepID=UPI0037AC09C5
TSADSGKSVASDCSAKKVSFVSPSICTTFYFPAATPELCQPGHTVPFTNSALFSITNECTIS